MAHRGPTRCLTGRQWAEHYLLPLSRTDLLSDHLVCGVTALGVARQHWLKTATGDHGQRSADGFRILLDHRDGSQSVEAADIVIDATGVLGQPNWCGAGGLPARGESRLRSRIEYSIPDVLGTERALYEARRVLVVGSGLSAAATVVALAKLMQRVPQTDVTWVTQASPSDASTGPIALAPYNELPAQRRLAEAGNQLAQSSNPRLIHRAGVLVEAIEYDAADQQFLVTFDSDAQPVCFDRIIANVGHRPDRSLYQELQVRECPRTGGPWGVSQRLGRNRAATAPATSEHAATRLITTEPNFYILGAKSYGRDASYLMTDGFAQIRDLYALIGGRATLDLYATATELDS